MSSATASNSLSLVWKPGGPTATIVCPGYYELHELLRSSVDRSLGQAVDVVGVETRVDPDWQALDTDLVLTTIDAPVVSDRIVRIQPFLTENDIERVQAAAGRVRRARRLARLRAELERRWADMPSISIEDFLQRVHDAFDVLYEEAAKTPRVMSIALHPFLIGSPHRIRYLDRALQYIKGHDKVWFATGAEIIEAYKTATGEK